MNDSPTRAECYDEFLPKTTFWKFMKIFVTILIAALSGLTLMSTTMDAAIMGDIDTLDIKASLIDRLDERTISIQAQLDRIEKKLQ